MQSELEGTAFRILFVLNKAKERYATPGTQTERESGGRDGVFGGRHITDAPPPFHLRDAALTPIPRGPISPLNWNIREAFVGNDVAQRKKRLLCLKTEKQHFTVDLSFRNFLAFSEGKKKEQGVWFLQFPFLTPNIFLQIFVSFLLCLCTDSSSASELQTICEIK